MIDPKRIVLMTKLTAYEEREGKYNLKLFRYFKEDYIAVNMVYTAIAVTVAYLIMVVLWFVHGFETIMANLQETDLIQIAFRLVMGYVALLVVFLVIAYFVYRAKWKQAQPGIRQYTENLKKLDEMNRDENGKSGYTTSMGGVVKYDEVTGA